LFAESEVIQINSAVNCDISRFFPKENPPEVYQLKDKTQAD